MVYTQITELLEEYIENSTISDLKDKIKSTGIQIADKRDSFLNFSFFIVITCGYYTNYAKILQVHM